MSCQKAQTVLNRDGNQAIKGKWILTLYERLDAISECEDNPDNKKPLEVAENEFKKFFTKKNKREFWKLLQSNILQAKQSDKLTREANDEGQDEDWIDGESLLFRAMSIPAEKDSDKDQTLGIIKERMIKEYPEMIIFGKKKKTYNGITPIHVAILKWDRSILQLMAKSLENTDKKTKEKVRNICADGPVFQNTAMLAGTLIGVAALKFDHEVFDIVLQSFASGLDQCNKKGDSIVHSLIKYAHVQRDKHDLALDMLRSIMSGKFVKLTSHYKPPNVAKDVRKLLMMKNKEHLTALQLAAKRQQYEFFEFIMDQEVYSYNESNNGLASEKVHDITEIETLRIEANVEATVDEDIKEEYHESILEYLVHHETQNAFRFADFLPVKEVIKEKWIFYRKYFWVLLAFHFIFMIGLSIAALYRSKVSGSVEMKFEYRVTKNVFVTFISVTGLLLGISYLVLESVRLTLSRFVGISRFKYKTSSHMSKRVKHHFTSPYSNFLFRIYIILFYILLIFDFCVAVSQSQWYHNECLIFSVIIGWYLFMFYLQGFKSFSFFTVLIQRVVVDMMKFALVMLIFLIAFSVAMFMIMQGANTDGDDFNHFGKTMVKMLMIMIGIGDLDVLFQARRPILAIIVFVLFVLLTTILLLNALIALMSNTCTDLMSNHRGTVASKMHCRLQKLSLVLFLESYIPRACCKEVGSVKTKMRYDNNEWSLMPRRCWSLSSVHEHRTGEIEDISNNYGIAQLFSGIRNGKEMRNKKRSKKRSVVPVESMKIRPESQVTRQIEVSDMIRTFCPACGANQMSESQIVEIKEQTVETTHL